MKLFTMVITSDQRTVLPVAFCLAKQEDTATFTAWLLGIQDRMPPGWKPSCVITDASKPQITAAE